MHIVKLSLSLALVMSLAAPVTAHGVHVNPDRIEDRMDRRENRRDEAVDHGPLDVIEDYIDRAEDRHDRQANRRHYHRGNKVIIIQR